MREVHCEHDEEMNFEIRLNRWKDHNKNWDMYYNNIYDINSLRNLNEFEIFLINLYQNGTKIELDEDCLNDETTPEKEPAPTFE